MLEIGYDLPTSNIQLQTSKRKEDNYEFKRKSI